MNRFDEQIQRIINKFPEAKNKDQGLRVFGADSHRYVILKPIEEAEIQKFEKEYQVSLPECYKSFLTQIGNGGVSYARSAAGPFYGIYPFGENANELIENPKVYLSHPVKIYPNMTDEYWNELIKRIEEDNTISDEDFEIEKGNIYSGILPIGSQGCTYLHAIILNGEYKGKVVNLDLDRQKPHFTYEINFLDWYERWLDEIISGELIKKSPSWFGFSLGGTEKFLLVTYFMATDSKTKQDSLISLLNKVKIASDTLDLLEKEYSDMDNETDENILKILTKFDYKRAKSYLLKLSNRNFLLVLKFVFWFAKHKSNEWIETIEKNIANINDEETFTFCTDLLIASGIDFAYLIIPFTSHTDVTIRATAFYSLGMLKNKADYIEIFILGLNDDSSKVIHVTLQALYEVKDERLLKHYKKIVERFPVEQDYILANLSNRLIEFGLSESKLKEMNLEESETIENLSKKWFQFWK